MAIDSGVGQRRDYELGIFIVTNRRDDLNGIFSWKRLFSIAGEVGGDAAKKYIAAGQVMIHTAITYAGNVHSTAE